MRQFAQQYESKYSNTAWINAESQKTIEESFKHLAAILKLELDHNNTMEAIVTKVYKHIETFCDPNASLIIFDNVTDLVEIRNSLPTASSIKSPPLIVMTANVPSEAYRNVQLKELHLAEALEVFQAFMKLSPSKLLEVKHLLEELALLVGCHPLALVISASHISRNKNTRYVAEELRDYIASVRDLSDKFANSQPKLEVATAYRNTLKALWELTLRRLKENEGADAALYLVRLLGYLDPENVEERELRRLCVCSYPLVDEDDGWAAFFRSHGDRAVCTGISQLERLSVLMPISRPGIGMDMENPRFRVHRLLQHFARRQDMMQIGIRRVFYYCLDLIPPFIYPGCLEYLETMMEKKLMTDEKLKQTCIAVAITAKDVFPSDMLARLISHFEIDGSSSDETEVLLLMAQLSNASDNESNDASSVMETMSLVLSLAENWIQPGYGPYLIQNCALKIILNALFTSPECLDEAGWPEVTFSCKNSCYVKPNVDTEFCF